MPLPLRTPTCGGVNSCRPATSSYVSSSAAAPSHRQLRSPGRSAHIARAEPQDGDRKKYIGEMDLLDFMYAGPKMRKWYGEEMKDKATEEEQQDGQPPPPPQPQEENVELFDALVTDAETSMGEQLVLQLILARTKLRVLVRDVAAAKAGFGPYIDPVSLDVSATNALARALRGVRTLVVLGRLGGLLTAAERAGVQRVVMLSTAGMPQPRGLAALFGDKADQLLNDPAREQELARSGLDYTVIKTAAIRDVPGGGSALSIQPGSLGGGSSDGGIGISREDLAAVIARAVEMPLPSGTVVEVLARGPGQPGDVGGALAAASGSAVAS